MARKRQPRRDSPKCAIVNRTVSFNVEDPFQAQLLEAADAWTNFSGSVKRLLSSYLNGGSVSMQISEQRMKVSHTPFSRVSVEVSETMLEPWDPSDLF